MQKLRSGFFKNMKPSIYNPASNTIKQIAIMWDQFSADFCVYLIILPTILDYYNSQ